MKNDNNPPDQSIEFQLACVRAMADRCVPGDEFIHETVRGQELGQFSLGSLLGHAHILNDTKSAWAIEWIYVNLHQNCIMDSFLEDAWNVLIEENKTDVFPHLMKRLHATCTLLWRYDKKRRDLLDEELKGEEFPDIQTMAPNLLQDVRSVLQREGTQGLGAWVALGESLLLMFEGAKYNQNFTPGSEKFLILVETIRDVLASVKDTRMWTAQILHKSINHQRGENSITKTARIKATRDMTSYLSDGAAAAWLRNMADEYVDEDKRNPAVEFTELAEIVVGQRPHVTLEQWFCLGNPGELDCVRAMEGRHNANIRTDLMDRTGLFHEICPEHRVAPLIKSYEQIVTWVGADRGDEITKRTANMLKELVKANDNRHISAKAAALQSALDLRDLREATSDPRKRTGTKDEITPEQVRRRPIM